MALVLPSAKAENADETRIQLIVEEVGAAQELRAAATSAFGQYAGGAFGAANPMAMGAMNAYYGAQYSQAQAYQAAAASQAPTHLTRTTSHPIRSRPTFKSVTVCGVNFAHRQNQ